MLGQRAAGPRGDESDDNEMGAAAQGDGRQCSDDWNAIESLAVMFGNMARDDAALRGNTNIR